MTLYIGIDVAKRFHVAALVGDDGAVLQVVRFDNDAAGYQLLHQTMGQYSAVEILIGMESIGHYGHALRDWLINQGLAVHIFNPLQPCRQFATFSRHVPRSTVGNAG